jgi:hypothetical protein
MTAVWPREAWPQPNALNLGSRNTFEEYAALVNISFLSRGLYVHKHGDCVKYVLQISALSVMWTEIVNITTNFAWNIFCKLKLQTRRLCKTFGLYPPTERDREFISAGNKHRNRPLNCINYRVLIPSIFKYLKIKRRHKFSPLLCDRKMRYSATKRATHFYIHTYIPWSRKFVKATIGRGINHKDTKHTRVYPKVSGMSR